MNKLAIILLIIIMGGVNIECKNRKLKKALKGTITTETHGTKTQNQNNGTIAAISNGSLTAINWYTLNEAKKEQEKMGLPFMIDFYANWCFWCKMFDNATFKDKDVIRESLNFIPVKIDCTENRTIATEYRILGFPTIVFEGTQGTRYDVVGFRPPKDFIKEMKNALKKVNP